MDSYNLLHLISCIFYHLASARPLPWSKFDTQTCNHVTIVYYEMATLRVVEDARSVAPSYLTGCVLSLGHIPGAAAMLAFSVRLLDRVIRRITERSRGYGPMPMGHLSTMGVLM
jgi:hypothetical protein